LKFAKLSLNKSRHAKGRHVFFVFDTLGKNHPAGKQVTGARSCSRARIDGACER